MKITCNLNYLIKYCKYLLLFLFIIFFNPKIYSAETAIHYDTPIQKEEFNLGKNKYNSADLIRNCYQYPDFMLIEEIDKEQKGGALIGLAPVKKGTNFLATCKQKYTKFKLKMTAEGYFGGKIGNYIINNGDEAFGSEDRFEIYKINKNKLALIFASARHTNKNFEFLKNSLPQLGVRYWKSLKADFDCSVHEKSCLNKIKASNKILTALNFTNCLQFISERASKLKNEDYDLSYLDKASGNQFFIHIEIPNISNPHKYKILNNNVICETRP